MATTRACEQCGAAFVRRREHSRFCSAQCRVAWNSEHARHEGVSSAALDWSLSAMTEATARLARSRPPGGTAEAHAVVAVSDAVWWVTIVDATLIRYHPDSYDATMDALPAARQQEIGQTLAGLRFARNQMGVHLDPGEFIGVLPDPGNGERRGATLTWSPVSPPAAGDLSPSGQEWERGRYLAYTERLAGQSVVHTFTLAARFLRHAAASAAAAQDEATAAAEAPQEALPRPAAGRGAAS
jgi:hypothetical protein